MPANPNLLPVSVLAELLADCAKQFRFYEEQHRAKGTPEAYEKSKVNGAFAHRIECFLNSGIDYEAPPPSVEADAIVERLRGLLKEEAEIVLSTRPLEEIARRQFDIMTEKAALVTPALLALITRLSGGEVER